MRPTMILFGVAIALVLVAPASAQANAPTGATLRAGAAVIPALYKNCTALNRKYPHGVGKLRARDKTTGTPVTRFKRSTRLYNIAVSYNKGLDRDKDGIACEKR